MTEQGSANSCVVVYVTAPADAAEPLARSIVDQRLAACANIVPAVRSVYRWQGAVEVDEESLLIIKTAAVALDALTAHVVANHPYDTPEVIATSITGGAEPYLAWIADSVQVPTPPPVE